MIRAFLTYLPSTILPRLTAFATILAGARLLSPTEFGYFSLVMVIGEFADIALTNWIRIALARFGARKDGVSYQFSMRMCKVALMCTFAALLISVSVARLLAPENVSAIAFAVSAYVIAASLTRFGVTLHQTMEASRRASFLESVRVLLGLFMTLGVMASSRNFLYASLAASAVNFVVGVLAVVTGLRAARRDLSSEISLKILLSFAWPLVVLALLSQTITSLDKALLKSSYDAATLGYYAAAFAVGRAGFDAVAVAFNTGAFVRLSMLFNEREQSAAEGLLSRQMAYLLAIGLPAAGILIASRDLIARVFFPPAYFETFVTVIPFVAFGAIALNLKNFVYDVVFHLHVRNLRQIPTLVVGAATSVLLGLWLLPERPLLGAAVMFAGGGIAALLTSLTLARSLMQVRMPWKSAFASAAFGFFAWGAGVTAKMFLGYAAPDLVLLVTNFFVGVMAAGGSLAIAYVFGKSRGSKVGISFISTNPDRVTGLSSYAESLVSAMADHPNRPELVFLTNARHAMFGRLTSIPDLEWVAIPDRPRGVPYKLYNLIIHDLACWRARLEGCRYYVSVTAAGAVLPAIDQVMTLHDLYDVDQRFRPWRTTIYAHVLWRWLAMVSRRIICVSATTAEEAKRFVPFAADKLRIVKEASKFAAQEVSHSTESEHFLFVANVQPVKNVECLLEALRRDGGRIRVNWVGWDVTGAVEAWTCQHGTPIGFNSIGQLSEDELREAYRDASALIVTSWKEGFCLPVLEAHSLGVPVIASDIPVLREVAGGGALFFDPHDPESLLEAMRSFARNPHLRQQLSKEASANAQLYSWGKAAADTFKILEAV